MKSVNRLINASISLASKTSQPTSSFFLLSTWDLGWQIQKTMTIFPLHEQPLLLDIIEETTEMHIQCLKELLCIFLLKVRMGWGNKCTYLLSVLNVPCFKTSIRSRALIDAKKFRIGRDIRSQCESNCLFI